MQILPELAVCELPGGPAACEHRAAEGRFGLLFCNLL